MSFIAPFPGGGKVTAAFLDHGETLGISSASSFSFAGLNVGAAAANRCVICGVAWGGGTVSLTGLTIGGVAATILTQVQCAGTANSFGVALAIALIPSGTSATVAGSFSNPVSARAVAIYSLFGVSSLTPSVLTTSNAASPSASLPIPGGGLGISVAQGAAASPPSSSWSGLNKDFDGNYGNANNICRSMASLMPSSALTVTATCSFSPVVGGDSAGCFAVFNPL